MGLKMGYPSKSFIVFGRGVDKRDELLVQSERQVCRLSGPEMDFA